MQPATVLSIRGGSAVSSSLSRYHRRANAMTSPPTRASVFRYLRYEVDDRKSELRCHYGLDDHVFEERITVGPGDWASPAVHEAARIVHMLAGVSYYKAGAPPVIDLGAVPVRPGERRFLLDYYVNGLGEFAYRNSIDLDLRVVGGSDPAPRAAFAPSAGRPLIPFGGGIDSIVTAETVRRARACDPSLFVVSQAGQRFAAIEDAAAVTGLRVLRAERALDPQILRSDDFGFLNGHVPVTGILSAIAVLAATVYGNDAVVMSNERSASSGNVEVAGRMINHQYSKSDEFERAFRSLLRGALDPPPEYFSLLRPWSELAVAAAFASLRGFHPVFRSCNRAFHIDPAQRLATWCGRCDKCCFIDLVLAPFLDAGELDAIFGGLEPLENVDLLHRFRTLTGLSSDTKPFECVGDVDECRGAVVLAAARRDRQGSVVLKTLVDELGPVAGDTLAATRLLQPGGASNVPEPYATARRLG